MAAALMQRYVVDACIVGADRVVANGDSANKIGTYSLAVLSRHHGVLFYVAAPLTTLDAALLSWVMLGDVGWVGSRLGGKICSSPHNYVAHSFPLNPPKRWF